MWGVGEGPYLFIPLLGPHNTRHLAGRVADIFMDPLTYLGPGGWEIQVATWTALAFRVVDTRSRVIEELEDLEKNSLDLYATIRSLYRQNRASEIRNGRPAPPTVAPEIVE